MNNIYTKLNNINWDDVRFFLAAAELGSLSAAARQLNSNQPTVGRHIDRLEQRLGVRLFQRHKKGLTLTQEGMRVLEHSQLMSSGVQNILRMVDGGYQQLHGCVRLAIPEGLGNAVVVPHLEQFYQRYPNLRLILNISSQAANLTRGEADIALRLFRPEEGDLVARQLGCMGLGLYASPHYLEQHSCPQDIADLAEHKIIAYGDELSALPENQWLLDHTRVEHWLIQSNSTMSRLAATENGLGISIQPCLVAEHEPELIRVLPDVPLPSHIIWLVYHQDLRHIPRISVTVEFLTGLIVPSSVKKSESSGQIT